MTVTSWGLRLPDGQSLFVSDPFPGSDELPYRLDEGATGNWRVDTAALAEACNSKGISYEELRAYVTLGNGKTVLAEGRGIGARAWFPLEARGGRVALIHRRPLPPGLSTGQSNLVDELLDMEEAAEIVGLMDSILGYVYQEPAKIAKIRSRRQRRQEAANDHEEPEYEPSF